METDNINQPVPPVNNIQPTQAPLPNPSSHSKTFIIVFGIVLLVVLGIGIYVLSTSKNQAVIQQQTITSPTVTQPSPTPDPTANWKTFTETNTGFTLKYPSNWSHFALPDNTGGYLAKVALTPQSPNFPVDKGDPNGVVIYVLKLNTRDCTNSADYAQKELNDYIRLKDKLYPGLEIKPLNLNNIYGYIIYKGAPGVEAQKGPGVYIFRCPKEIQVSFDPTGIENSEQIFNQILSTFKFTD